MPDLFLFFLCQHVGFVFMLRSLANIEFRAQFHVTGVLVENPGWIEKRSLLRKCFLKSFVFPALYQHLIRTYLYMQTWNWLSPERIQETKKPLAAQRISMEKRALEFPGDYWYRHQIAISEWKLNIKQKLNILCNDFNKKIKLFKKKIGRYSREKMPHQSAEVWLRKPLKNPSP